MRRLAALVFLLLAPATARAQDNALFDAVDGYVLYQNDITELLTLDFTDTGAIDDALILTHRHDPARVASGYLAYGALTAAQSPAFVAGVRSRVRAAGRAAVLRQLNRDASYARRRPPGAAEAINLILISSAADSTRMIAAGHRYSGAGEGLIAGAFDPAQRDARTADLRTLAGMALDEALAARVHPALLAASPLTNADTFGGARFWDALANRASPAPLRLPWRESGAYTARMNHMLTAAGLYIVGAGNGDRARQMLIDEALTRCLAQELLELRQCASVAHDPNEDAHCIARHGLTEPAACFAAIARAS